MKLTDGFGFYVEHRFMITGNSRFYQVFGNRRVLIAFLATFLIPLIGGIVLHEFVHEANWVHLMMHSTLKVLGSVTAFMVVVLLLVQQQYQKESPHFLWISSALIFMGILEFFFGMIDLSPASFWARTLASVLGAVLFACSWLPDRWATPGLFKVFPLYVSLFSTFAGLSFILNPAILTKVSFFEKYGITTLFLHILSGVIFLAAMINYLYRYYLKERQEDYLFGLNCLLLGMSGLMQAFESTWSSVWWFFHGLKFFAYLILIKYIFGRFREIQRQLEQKLKKTEANFELAVSASQIGIWEWNPVTNLSVWNDMMYELLGYEFGQVQPCFESFSNRVHPDDRDHVFRRLNQSLEDQSLFDEEFRIVQLNGSLRWLLGRGQVHQDENNKIVMRGINLDITETKRVIEEKEFLADITKLFASSLDYKETMNIAAKAAIPRLADWSIVDLCQEDGSIKRLSVCHRDFQLQPICEEFRSFPPEIGGLRGVFRVLESGKSEIAPDFCVDSLNPGLREKYAVRLIQQLGLTGYMIFPLKSRDRMLGTISLMLSGSNRRMTGVDVSLAEEFARRVSTAVDNARLYHEANAAIQTRDEFMSIASHELKTPLTSLYLQLQMLSRSIRKQSLTTIPVARLSKTLEICESQGKKLSDLLDELLDLTRIRLGRLELQKINMDFAEVARAIVENHKVEADRNGVRLEVTAFEEIYGFWDCTRIEQMISNLVSNALKYGCGKPVEILVQKDKKLSWCILQVKDQGLGIPIELQSKIFERFERAVEGNKISGLGLGLYISRQIVEAHGGTIHVKSEVGKGSIFTVSLPLDSVVEVGALG